MAIILFQSKKRQMTLSQIEANIKKLVNHIDADNFIFDFLLAYDTPKSVIQRFKRGQLNLSKNADEIIWKKKLFYKVVITEEIQIKCQIIILPILLLIIITINLLDSPSFSFQPYIYFPYYPPTFSLYLLTIY